MFKGYRTNLSMDCLLFGSHRNGQRSFHGPTQPRQSSVQRDAIDSERVCPIGQTLRLSVVRYHPIIAFVTVLSFPCRPTAVARAIGTVIVNTFNAVLRRGLLPHVGEEVFKCFPSLANGNPAFTVVVVVDRVGIVTPLEHTLPQTVLRREILAMFRVCAPIAFFAVSASEKRSPNGFLDSALAMAKPESVPLLAVGMKPKNGPFSKYLAGQVYKVGMSFGRIAVSHDRTPFTKLMRTARRSNPSGCSHYTTGRMGDVAHA